MTKSTFPKAAAPFGVAELKASLLALRGPADPLYLAAQGLPDSASRGEYIAALRVLLPLARLRAG